MFVRFRGCDFLPKMPLTQHRSHPVKTWSKCKVRGVRTLQGARASRKPDSSRLKVTFWRLQFHVEMQSPRKWLWVDNWLLSWSPGTFQGSGSAHFAKNRSTTMFYSRWAILREWHFRAKSRKRSRKAWKSIMFIRFRGCGFLWNCNRQKMTLSLL